MNLPKTNPLFQATEVLSLWKKFIPLLLAILLFTACQQQTPKRYHSSSPEIDAVKSLLIDYHEGNWEAWTKHYGDTAKIYHNVLKGSTPKETVTALKNILANVSTYKFDDDNRWYEMVIDDDGETWVNFWGNWRGTLAANGQELEIPVSLTLQFIDGKIIEEYGYYNLSEFTSALAAIEMAKIESENKQ